MPWTWKNYDIACIVSRVAQHQIIINLSISKRKVEFNKE